MSNISSKVTAGVHTLDNTTDGWQPISTPVLSTTTTYLEVNHDTAGEGISNSFTIQSGAVDIDLVFDSPIARICTLNPRHRVY